MKVISPSQASRAPYGLRFTAS